MSSNVFTRVKEIHRSKEGCPSFLYRVLPTNVCDLKMTFPEQFHKQLGSKISTEVKLYFSNGDRFVCQYLKEDKCLLGVRKIVERYNIENYSVIYFEYLGASDFYASLIGHASVEVEYPIDSEYFPFQVETVCPNNNPLNRNSSPELDVINAMNANLVHYNGCGGGEPAIGFLFTGAEFTFEDRTVGMNEPTKFPERYWSNGSGIHVCVRGQCRQVFVRKLDGVITMGDGWTSFVAAVGLSTGDYVVLTQYGNPFHFEAVIFKGYANIGKRHSQNMYDQPLFVRFVNKDLISKGELYVPRIFWDKIVTLLDGEVHLNVIGGSEHSCQYLSASHQLVGLEDFVARNRLWKSKVLLFRYVGDYAFSVTIISKHWVGHSFYGNDPL